MQDRDKCLHMFKWGSTEKGANLARCSSILNVFRATRFTYSSSYSSLSNWENGFVEVLYPSSYCSRRDKCSNVVCSTYINTYSLRDYPLSF